MSKAAAAAAAAAAQPRPHGVGCECAPCEADMLQAIKDVLTLLDWQSMTCDDVVQHYGADAKHKDSKRAQFIRAAIDKCIHVRLLGEVPQSDGTTKLVLKKTAVMTRLAESIV